MTAPWAPMANPGGRNAEFVRKIVTQYLTDLDIAGLTEIWPDLPFEQLWDDGQGGPLYDCRIGVHLGDISDSFEVQTGPDDYGGYFARYDVMLELEHRCASVEREDWWQARDDHDRIMDAVKAGLKGPGRDLGRPDVILQSAAWPSGGSITSETDPPVYASGIRTQRTRISFVVSQYMQEQP